MRRLALLVPFVTLAGCSLFPDHGDDTHTGCAQPAIAEVIQLIDPSSLQCDSYTEGPACDPSCGEACPATAAGAGATEAIPSWGSCSSACRQMDEATCETSPACRIARNAAAYYSIGAQGSASGWTSDFVGCYPIDPGPIAPGSCASLDAADCATNTNCTALYDDPMCNSAGCVPKFAQCIPAHQLAGACTGAVACELAISCPAGTTPGIAGDCYTGSCIPNEYCD